MTTKIDPVHTETAMELTGYHIRKHCTISEIHKEMKQILELSGPIVALNLICYLKSAISVLSMGQLGQQELAAGSLAIGFTNITGYSVLSGLAMGMDPICSQAFGSRNFPLARLALRRTIIMMLCTSLPIGLLWFNVERIMLTLRQNAEISHGAGSYCMFSIPDLLANSLLCPLRIYLRSRSSVWPLMWCNAIATILHVPLTIFLSSTLNLGIPGIAIAYFCTSFMTLFFLLLWYWLDSRGEHEPHYEPLTLTSKAGACGESWGTLVLLTLPSCIGVCLEWWWYEIMTILAGYLADPTVALATSAIVIQTTSLFYTLPAALSASVSTRVGNQLGAGNPREAKLSAAAAMTLALSVSFAGLLSTIMARGPWARMFTTDKDTLRLANSVLPIIGLCEVANCAQTTGCGVLRGCARPSVTATVNLYSFYLVGFSVAISLAFICRIGFMGLCYGLLAAQFACLLSIASALYLADWEEESSRAKHLAGNSPDSCQVGSLEDGDKYATQKK